MMALEAVVSSDGLFGCWPVAASGGGGGWGWGHGHGGVVEGAMDLVGGSSAAASVWDGGASTSLLMPQGVEEPAGSSAAPRLAPRGGTGNAAAGVAELAEEGAAPVPAVRRKRRRARSVKNREEAESQRMTHIAVERNRRKQMNEYLAVLRAVMPQPYVQRGDQASIIGGAINYVKELEQLVQTLEARKHARSGSNPSPRAAGDAAAALPFAGFFTFPQYSTSAMTTAPVNVDGSANDDTAAAAGSRPSSVADIEVTMVESHASLRVLSRRRPRQLLRVVAGLQAHRLTVLHVNVTSAGDTALYSLSLKVEDDCRLSSVDDIAAAVHRIVEAIEREGKGDQLDGGGEPGSPETERNS